MPVQTSSVTFCLRKMQNDHLIIFEENRPPLESMRVIGIRSVTIQGCRWIKHGRKLMEIPKSMISIPPISYSFHSPYLWNNLRSPVLYDPSSDIKTCRPPIFRCLPLRTCRSLVFTQSSFRGLLIGMAAHEWNVWPPIITAATPEVPHFASLPSAPRALKVSVIAPISIDFPVPPCPNTSILSWGGLSPFLTVSKRMQCCRCISFTC